MQAPVPRADRTHRPRRAARRFLAAGGLAWALTDAVTHAVAQVPVPAPAAVLTLHYQERPPYSQTAPDGHVHGLLAAPANRACQKAQLSCTWARTPGQRFSAPLYQDRPYMALARRGTAWEAQRSLPGLLSDAALPLLVKEGYSYGSLLDGLIAQHAGQVRRTSAESQQMVRMIEAGRAGWMIVAPEEAEVLLADPGAAGAPPQLQLHPLPGVPAGQTRHLYCNKAVPEAVVERLNRALAER
jgi:polar amino acid transport system substrate-binding protein